MAVITSFHEAKCCSLLPPRERKIAFAVQVYSSTPQFLVYSTFGRINEFQLIANILGNHFHFCPYQGKQSNTYIYSSLKYLWLFRWSALDISSCGKISRLFNFNSRMWKCYCTWPSTFVISLRCLVVSSMGAIGKFCRVGLPYFSADSYIAPSCFHVE